MEHIAARRLEIVLVDWTPPYLGLSPLFRRTAVYSTRLASFRSISSANRVVVNRIAAPPEQQAAELSTRFRHHQ